jgi:2-polyprenyl-3-methyl-5-hydroxy-6-metoxy-1,4-benzoquinol methylase
MGAYYREAFWRDKPANWKLLYEAQRDWLAARDGDILSAVEAHTPGRSLLDVGAGFGWFMRAAVSRGWNYVVGLDPNRDAAEYARAALGMHVEPVTWEDYGVGRGIRYHAVTAFHVLEHLACPMHFLLWCGQTLAPGGVLCLAVPHEFTALQAEASARAWVRNYFVAPSHTNYFSAATLGNLLGRAGFRVVDWLSSYPVERWLLAGQDYTDRADLGAKLHAELRAAELGQTREQRLAEMRARVWRGEGRDLYIVAKREGE